LTEPNLLPAGMSEFAAKASWAATEGRTQQIAQKIIE